MVDAIKKETTRAVGKNRKRKNSKYHRKSKKEAGQTPQRGLMNYVFKKKNKDPFTTDTLRECPL